MTISNILTISRIFLSPVFLALVIAGDSFGLAPEAYIVILWTLYILMELSDFFDGFFARLLKQSTDLGKILDPFADSVSRLTCFLAFTFTGLVPLWIFVIVLYRDLWVSFIRVLMARKGLTMGARFSGKAKAWVYAFALILALLAFSARKVLIFYQFYDTLIIFCTVGFYCVALIALWSALDYSTVLFGKKKLHKS